MMDKWNQLNEKKPLKKGDYLVERISDTGEDFWFQVDQFKKHKTYERRFSKEFNQYVHVLLEETKLSFQDDQDSFVVRWMEIPE